MAAIGVVIPAYNPGELLHRALDSVTSQTMVDWECVVVDDGSAEDLSWVERVDPRVHLVRQTNRGTSAARNAGAAALSADLLAYLDQDDEWLPEKLELQLPVFADPQVGLCDTDFAIVKADTVVATGYAPHHGTYTGLLTGGAIGLSTVVIRRTALEAAGGFNPCLRIMQDFDLYLRILMLDWTAHRLEQSLARYRLHDHNTSADFRLAFAEHSIVLAEHRTRAEVRGDHAVLTAIRTCEQATRRVFGAQAFDAFRSHRRPLDLALALRLDRGRTMGALVRKAVGHGRVV